jgi:hypothetical protein
MFAARLVALINTASKGMPKLKQKLVTAMALVFVLLGFMKILRASAKVSSLKS